MNKKTMTSMIIATEPRVERRAQRVRSNDKLKSSPDPGAKWHSGECHAGEGEVFELLQNSHDFS